MNGPALMQRRHFLNHAGAAAPKEQVANNFCRKTTTGGRGKAKRAPVANAGKSRGTLRFAPATLTQISRDVITRQFLSSQAGYA
jgi:hypothetical protein